MNDDPHHTGYTRRDLLRSAAAGALASTALGNVMSTAAAQPATTTRPAAEAELPLVLALQSFPDPDTEAKVRKVWRDLSDAGVGRSYYRGGGRPHVTTASWRVAGWDEAWMHALAEFCETQPRVPVRFRADWGDEGRRLYLIPDQTEALLAYHQRVHDAFPDLGQPFRPNDFPGRWRPHLTVASWEPADTDRARDLCAPLAEPFEAELEYLGFVTFGRSNRFMATFPFTADAADEK